MQRYLKDESNSDGCDANMQRYLKDVEAALCQTF